MRPPISARCAMQMQMQTRTSVAPQSSQKHSSWCYNPPIPSQAASSSRNMLKPPTLFAATSSPQTGRSKKRGRKQLEAEHASKPQIEPQYGIAQHEATRPASSAVTHARRGRRHTWAASGPSEGRKRAEKAKKAKPHTIEKYTGIQDEKFPVTRPCTGDFWLRLEFEREGTKKKRAGCSTYAASHLIPCDSQYHHPTHRRTPPFLFFSFLAHSKCPGARRGKYANPP
ncbi:hypothetical protein BS50DRAFT_184153 [Corynespora cassiicola Philippines]|uniref:Uncharacterized protein n=1 Tax=Corynespora cassiicola Philippines TaxID=1448308 RepID=A0A2T2P6D4_CORCC|nr:hypothetical protein BS50DRAFT_184153 [Corynespora cassiicola Philippines]